MRANTSLCGHIFGSNPEIEGYYELHIGYYSWRSRLRQKLLYFADHKPKPEAKFLFDKVLHNEHSVAIGAFNKGDRIVISLRKPEATIPSIVKLYQSIDSSHECATLKGAQEYYCSRLKGLCDLSEQFKGQYLYFKAEELVESPDSLLQQLTRWLGLKAPLTTEYQTFNKTGDKKAGDSSDNLKQGKIVRPVTSDHSPVSEAISELYHQTDTLLRRNSELSGG